MSSNPFWGDDWESVRSLWPLAPDVAHCNHGSFGAVPHPVLEVQDEYRSRMAKNPVSWFAREMPDLVKQARMAVAAFLEAQPDDIGFVNNVSAGVSAVVQSLHLKPGAEVLSSNHIYGAVSYALDRLCARTGAVRVVADIPYDATNEEVAKVFAQHCSERTSLVVVDQVTSSTARRFPVQEVVRAAHEVGAVALVDGAHAPGMLPVNVPALGADFWTGNLHKWACAPPGSALLWVAPEWQEQMLSLVVSWSEHDGFPLSFEHVGTDDLSAWLAAPVALELLGSLGWERVRSHNETLVCWAQSTVAEILGIKPERLRHDPGISMATVPLPSANICSKEEAKALQDHIAKLGVETAISSWSGGTLRLSSHVYNRPSDYQRLGLAVRECLLR
jgi:isopenicillin-N epimerase